MRTNLSVRLIHCGNQTGIKINQISHVNELFTAGNIDASVKLTARQTKKPTSQIILARLARLTDTGQKGTCIEEYFHLA
jgi:hypothetical protein